jgi:branched-subunit amino acid aminotransferase/4-amino-4-deoxychorismate lyase
VTEPQVYLNGQVIPASKACLPISDSGIVLGATVSEMTRTFNHQPFRLNQHLDRLFRSLGSMRLECGLSREELAAISHELIGHNTRLLDTGGELGLIQFVTAGEYATFAGMLGRPARSTATVCVHTFPLPFERWARKMVEGAHLVIPSLRQAPPQCHNPHMKCRSRMHFYLADLEARQVDNDASALLLDLQGNVTETATANFLAVEHGTVISPSLTNILPGISRAVVMELAVRMGIPFVERDLPITSVLQADEAFTTSTPYCLMPVTRINGQAIGTGRPGPVYQKFADAWSQLVGVDIIQQILDGAR